MLFTNGFTILAAPSQATIYWKTLIYCHGSLVVRVHSTTALRIYLTNHSFLVYSGFHYFRWDTILRTLQIIYCLKNVQVIFGRWIYITSWLSHYSEEWLCKILLELELCVAGFIVFQILVQLEAVYFPIQSTSNLQQCNLSSALCSGLSSETSVFLY